jgi:hypothetical protein
MSITPLRLAVPILLCSLVIACGAANEKQPPTVDFDALNSARQKVYPDFPIPAQLEAMATIEKERASKRIDALREKTPPADWIALAYHGLVLDANLDVIEMTPDNVTKIQQSILEMAMPRVQSDPTSRGVQRLFTTHGLDGGPSVKLRTKGLQALLARSPSDMRERYEWRLRLLPGANAGVHGLDSTESSLEKKLREFGIEDVRPSPRPELADTYIETCRAARVPIPPNWPDTRWISQGRQALVLISKSLDAEVFAFKDPAVPGVCYALPRRDSTGSVQILGIICQSAETGKACFWDNKARDDTPLTGVGLTLDINVIGNGFTLGETCTDCHRGDNAFNIHPGTALDLSRAGATGGPYVTDPAVRYTAIGQSHWINPPALTLPRPPAGQSSCTACHDLPETKPASGTKSPFCDEILHQAAMVSMPPFGPAKAGWPPSVNPKYADHISRLAACP